MGLKEGEEAFHDVQMSLTQDPATLEEVYVISQIDVTAAVLAKRQLQAANSKLAEEQVSTEGHLFYATSSLHRTKPPTLITNAFSNQILCGRVYLHPLHSILYRRPVRRPSCTANMS